MAAFLSHISVARPDYQTDQASLADFMLDKLTLTAEEAQRLKVIYRASGIKSRFSVLPDFQSEYSEFFTKDLPFPSVRSRMELYKKHALPLAKTAISGLFEFVPPEKITHLIVVSCTGLYAPGLDIELIRDCHMSPQVERTSIQYMGCYAAFNGLKTAKHIVHSVSGSKVALVCVELCSIHLQKDASEDSLLSNALFGDGAAAALISSEPLHSVSFELIGQYNDLHFDGIQEMSWDVGNHGFEMKLSQKVPNYIKSGIKKLTDQLLKHFHLKDTEVDYFAIHPGGKRILEVIQEELNLSKSQIRPSLDILKNHGNMSSATILFVLKEIMKSVSTEDNHKWLLSFAFGPGLTLESLLMKIHVR